MFSHALKKSTQQRSQTGWGRGNERWRMIMSRPWPTLHSPHLSLCPSSPSLGEKRQKTIENDGITGIHQSICIQKNGFVFIWQCWKWTFISVFIFWWDLTDMNVLLVTDKRDSFPPLPHRPPYPGPRVSGRALQELPDGDTEVHGFAGKPTSPDWHPLVPERRPHPNAHAGPQGDAGAEIQAGAHQQRHLWVSSQQ